MPKRSGPPIRKKGVFQNRRPHRAAMSRTKHMVDCKSLTLRLTGRACCPFKPAEERKTAIDQCLLNDTALSSGIPIQKSINKYNGTAGSHPLRFGRIYDQLNSRGHNNYWVKDHGYPLRTCFRCSTNSNNSCMKIRDPRCKRRQMHFIVYPCRKFYSELLPTHTFAGSMKWVVNTKGETVVAVPLPGQL